MWRWAKARETLLALERSGLVKGEGKGRLGRGGAQRGVPFLELLAVRIVFDVADHEVGEVAVFVREDVEEAVSG